MPRIPDKRQQLQTSGPYSGINIHTKATLLVFAREARSLLFLAWLRPLPLAADPDTFEPVIDDADDLRDRFRDIN